MVDTPTEWQLSFDPHRVARIQEAAEAHKKYQYHVVALNLKNIKLQELTSFLKIYSNKNSLILFSDSFDSEALYQVQLEWGFPKVLQSLEANDVERVILSELDKMNLQKQNSQLLQLFEEQNRSLTAFNKELADRIEKRQQNIEKSKERLKKAEQQSRLLQNTLIEIHHATSTSELETYLQNLLIEPFQLKWLKIIHHGQGLLGENLFQLEKQFSVHHVDLFNDNEKLGKIYLAKDGKKKFTKEEIQFFSQVADAISLALIRIYKMDQLNHLKHQWESTFNAISNPICLTDHLHRILRSNTSFHQLVGVDPPQTLKNAFEVVFNMHKNPTFKNELPIILSKVIQGQEHSFEITRHQITNKHSGQNFYLLIFQDKTEQQIIEQRLLKSSKMAELGTIGSSIAHELNNPLGGMISFLQMIQMDLENGSIKKDIDEMLAAALRSKDIIENLLGFSRKNQEDQYTPVLLKKVLERSIKIVELQSKSQGIEIILDVVPEDIEVLGHDNLLAQAFCNILQNSIDAIIEKKQSQPQYEGVIRIEVRLKNSKPTVTISDNGVGFSPELKSKIFNPLFTSKDPAQYAGLGLTTALQIIIEHGGDLEIFSQPTAGTSAKISFQRLDL